MDLGQMSEAWLLSLHGNLLWPLLSLCVKALVLQPSFPALSNNLRPYQVYKQARTAQTPPSRPLSKHTQGDVPAQEDSVFPGFSPTWCLGLR